MGCAASTAVTEQASGGQGSQSGDKNKKKDSQATYRARLGEEWIKDFAKSQETITKKGDSRARLQTSEAAHRPDSPTSKSFCSSASVASTLPTYGTSPRRGGSISPYKEATPSDAHPPPPTSQPTCSIDCSKEALVVPARRPSASLPSGASPASAMCSPYSPAFANKGITARSSTTQGT